MNQVFQHLFDWVQEHEEPVVPDLPPEPLLAPAVSEHLPLINDLRPSIWAQVPIAKPLPQAIEHGVFGTTTDGPIELDAEEIQALTVEQARELVALFAGLQAVEDALRTGEDPRTGRQPKTPEAEVRLHEYLECEAPRLAASYADNLAAYATTFGSEPATTLDIWVRKTVADCTIAPGCRYDPGHPWYYYHEGDNAPPIPVEDIEPDLEAGRFLERDLPKNRAKRTAKIRALLATEHERLEEDKRRYQDIVERGAEALSRYDREIAHSSDAMARATALALKYNHIRYGLGRLAWLQAHAPLGSTLSAPLNKDAGRDKDSPCNE